MCFNSKLSLVSFIISIIGVIILYYRNYSNDKYFALIFLFIALIQLGEFFIWIGIDNKNKLLNIIGSYIIHISLYMQIIISYLCIFFVTNNIIYIYIIIIITILFIYLLYKKINDITTKIGNNNNLVWNTYNNDNIFIKLFCLFYLTYPIIILFIFKNKLKSLLWLILFYISFIFLYIKYKLIISYEWKSLWCYIGAFSPYFILFFCKK